MPRTKAGYEKRAEVSGDVVGICLAALATVGVLNALPMSSR